MSKSNTQPSACPFMRTLQELNEVMDKLQSAFPRGASSLHRVIELQRELLGPDRFSPTRPEATHPPAA